MSAPSELARLGTSGERSRRAQETFARATTELLVALRRALPFLARKRVAVVAAPPRTTLFTEIGTAIPNLAFSTAFMTSRGNRGLLAMDAAGIGRVLDGVLGGGDAPEGDAFDGPLSSAQIALASKVCGGLLTAFAGALRSQLNIEIEATPLPVGTPETGACASLAFTMAGGGLVVLGLPLSVLSEGESTTESDGAMAAAMEDVEIDVVAELGKVRVPLSTLSSLAVGDVLQLPLSLDDRARVCAGGAVLFRGRPTAIGLTIGVAIERHGT
jgi:flagellar motor switch protein FliM